MGHDVGDFVCAERLVLDFAELERGFFGINANWLEAALDVVEDSEVFASLGHRNNIHEAEWVTRVSSDSVVNFYIGVLVPADFDCLLAGESISESVAEQY